MKIGQKRVNISPTSDTFYLIGYKSPDRNQPAQGIHDELYLNGLLLEVAGKQLFLASFDFLELEDEMVAEAKTLLAKQFQLDRDLILLMATHDHSSIMSYHKHWHSGEFDPDYYAFIMKSLVEVFAACQDSLEEATAKTGSQIITGFYGNRNHPGELADNEVRVITFQNQHDKTIGAIVNLAVHSTVLSAKNNYLTGDLVGQLAVKLAEQLGVAPLMMIGAAADSSNRNERQGDDFAELERVSSGLAAAIGQIPVDQTLAIDQIDYLTLAHSIYNDMTESHEQVRAFLASDSPLKNPSLIKKCEEFLQLPYYELTIPFNVLHLGELQLYTFPGELGSSLGLTLKQTSTNLGKIPLVAGYTNGFHYYFMSRSEYGLSFETIGNPVPAGEPEKIIQKMQQGMTLLENTYH